MPALADLQQRVRRAVVMGDAAGLEPLLVGGRSPRARLAIHRRHYETSLVTALLGKFPATAWLVGTPFLTEAATRFVGEHPPNAPCIAEYGEAFPVFLSKSPGADRVPYLRWFAQLEWHLGHVAVAIERPAVTAQELSRIDVEAVPQMMLTLQAGVRYLEAPWPIDELIRLYLTETAPDRWSMAPTDVWLEIRGARGEFQINRLEAGEFVFRTAILAGRSLADAFDCAIESSAAFDPASALAALVSGELVTAITRSNPWR